MGVDGAPSTAAGDSRGRTLPGFPVPSGMVSLVLSSNSMLFQSLGPQHPRRPPCGLLDPITPLRSPLPRWHLVVSLLMSPSVRPPQFSACQALGWPTGSGLCGCCPVDRPWHQLFPVQEVLEQACLPGSVQSIVFLLHDAPAKGGNEDRQAQSQPRPQLVFYSVSSGPQFLSAQGLKV